MKGGQGTAVGRLWLVSSADAYSHVFHVHARAQARISMASQLVTFVLRSAFVTLLGSAVGCCLRCLCAEGAVVWLLPT